MKSIRWTKLRELAATVAVFLRRLLRRFIADACPGRAAALAFSLLFALVPLTAVIISVLNAFGVFGPLVDEAQRLIVGSLVPTMGEEILEGISQFSANTRTLGFVGLFIFILTSVFLLNNTSRSLNAIFRFRSEKKFWATFSTYTSVIVIGTALIAASFVLGPILQSLVSASLGTALIGRTFVQQVLPFAFMFLILLLMIVLVPSGRVSLGSAAIGAVVGAVLWEIAKRIFVFWTGSVMRLSVIYGSLAAVPIFLLWLYLAWLIILLAVEVAAGHQYRSDDVDLQNEHDTLTVSRLAEATVAVAYTVMHRFQNGTTPLSNDEIHARFGDAMADGIIETLSGSKVLLQTEHGFLPSRSLESVTVDDLFSGLFVPNSGPTEDEEAEHSQIISRLIQCWEEDKDRSVTCLLDTNDSKSAGVFRLVSRIFSERSRKNVSTWPKRRRGRRSPDATSERSVGSTDLQ